MTVFSWVGSSLMAWTITSFISSNSADPTGSSERGSVSIAPSSALIPSPSELASRDVFTAAEAVTNTSSTSSTVHPRTAAISSGAGFCPRSCSRRSMTASTSRTRSRRPRGRKSIRRSSSRIAPRILG